MRNRVKYLVLVVVLLVLSSCAGKSSYMMPIDKRTAEFVYKMGLTLYFTDITGAVPGAKAFVRQLEAGPDLIGNYEENTEPRQGPNAAPRGESSSFLNVLGTELARHEPVGGGPQPSPLGGAPATSVPNKRTFVRRGFTLGRTATLGAYGPTSVP